MLKLATLALAGLGFVAAQSGVPTSLAASTTGSPTTPSRLGSCKILPGDLGWPNELEWTALSKKVGGNLIKYRPPGSVCANISGVYSAESCAAIRAVYASRNFTQNDPGAVEALWYTGNTCPPSEDPDTACTQGNFPEYVLKAKNARDIAEVLKFARLRDIRVVVKNTGHDFVGRSIGRGSIGIWMHEWQSYQTLDAFSSKCPGSTPYTAAKLTGGIQFYQVYKAAAATKRIIVGGASGTVGPVGGYITGGGHSGFSRYYGMAADQVLEFEIVTPAGEIMKVNECTRPELFWALRGGGAGTYAVVTSVTVKTYPEPKNVIRGSLTITSINPAGSEEWWSMVSAFQQALGRISDGNISGYNYIYFRPIKILSFSIMNPDSTVEQTDAVFAPLLAQLNALKNLAATYTYKVSETTWSGPGGIAATYALDSGNAPGTPNTGALMSSRLLPRSAWEKDPAAWLSFLKSLDAGGATAILGHLVSGGKVHENKNLDMALLPAWRIAENHAIVMAEGSLTDTYAELEMRKERLRKLTKPLRDWTPGGGSYLNEGDLNEPNKYQTFFGSSTPKLLRIKRQYDPAGTLYCGNCIGSDDYTFTDGKICRKLLKPVWMYNYKDPS